MTALRETEAWRALEGHYEEARKLHLRDLFAREPDRGTRLVLDAEGVYLDY